jgi:Protein of unknown function (DUF3106)
LKRGHLILGLALTLLAGLAAQPASAQNGERYGARQEVRREAAQKRRENAGGPAKGQQAERAAVGLPPKWVENLRDMPPDQRERFLQNNEKFNNLPPQRQAQIRQNLQKWDHMSPEQQDRIRATQRMLEQATPEQREHFQNDIVPKLEQMAPMRRARVIGHWRRLQAMIPAEQEAALHDPAFLGNLSPEEQSIVRDLNSMGNPPAQ